MGLLSRLKEVEMRLSVINGNNPLVSSLPVIRGHLKVAQRVHIHNHKGIRPPNTILYEELWVPIP